MPEQINLFPELGPVASRSDCPDVFVPRVMAQAPAHVVAMPEGSEVEKIAKAKAVLKWLMANHNTAISFSSGKDSSCTLGLAMSAAAELQAEGIPVKSFAVLTADTMVENPSVLAVAKKELAKLQSWFDARNLPGTIHIARPNLASQFAVAIIGGRALPSTPQTQRDCTTSWKSLPLTRLRKAVLGTNDLVSGKFVVSVTGVRKSESVLRAANMAARQESPDSIVQTNADGNVALAPIANWSWDDVFSYLGLASNGFEHTYSNFADVIQVYREAMGECMISGAGDDLKVSKPCSARTGCWTCLMVSNDKSMDQMIQEPTNAYMRPLARFRTFMANTFYDLSRRTWIGRSIDANGNIKFAPDGYSPAMMQELLRYALTIQIEEEESAERLGISPRFDIVSLEALISIDAMWSLQGFALPFTAMKIYRDIQRGARYPVPEVPLFPKVEIPKPRFIHVGAEWDQGEEWQYTGLRDVMADAFGGDGCSGNREIVTKGRTRTVMDVNTADLFSVDAESAYMFMDFEMDRLIDEWHGPKARRLAIEGCHVAGAGYRFYLSYGTISLAKGQLGKVDEILRRTSFRERFGLAGYQYDHATALSMSIAKPVFASLESNVYPSNDMSYLQAS